MIKVDIDYYVLLELQPFVSNSTYCVTPFLSYGMYESFMRILYTSSRFNLSFVSLL